jgi:hypothetical protein
MFGNESTSSGNDKSDSGADVTSKIQATYGSFDLSKESGPKIPESVSIPSSIGGKNSTGATDALNFKYIIGYLFALYFFWCLTFLENKHLTAGLNRLSSIYQISSICNRVQ